MTRNNKRATGEASSDKFHTPTEWVDEQAKTGFGNKAFWGCGLGHKLNKLPSL
jgi:hypothetical protein